MRSDDLPDSSGGTYDRSAFLGYYSYRKTTGVSLLVVLRR
jgi:hypothetical protein